MIYLEKIKIVDKTYTGSNVLKKNFTIECSDVNLFVGNQGCGKSTMLRLMQKNHPDLEITLTDFTKKNGVSSFYFDTERDNPRVKDPELFTNPDGTNRGIGYGGALSTYFHSHGEILEIFVIKPLLEAQNSVILLDEPESGLSITNQFKLIDAIHVAVKNNCQIFMATHCYPLIESFDVISLEHWKQMSGTDFISKIKKSSSKSKKINEKQS